MTIEKDRDVYQIQTSLIEFIITRFTPEVRIEPTTDLVANSIIGSIGVMELAVFIQEEFGVDPDLEDIGHENFGSVEKLADYIRGQINLRDHSHNSAATPQYGEILMED